MSFSHDSLSGHAWKAPGSPGPQVEWNQDCLVLTTLVASALEPKEMRRLLLRAGYQQARQEQRPEGLLQLMHAACHENADLAALVAKKLNAQFQAALAQARQGGAQELEAAAQERSWPLPRLWASFQMAEPACRELGRRLAHRLVWQGLRGLLDQGRTQEQAQALTRLGQENQALKAQVLELRQAPASPPAAAQTPPVPPAPAPACQGPSPEERKAKAQVRELRALLEEQRRQARELSEQLAAWRTLALRRDQAPCGLTVLDDACPQDCPGGCLDCAPAPCPETCPARELCGRTVAVIGGLSRLAGEYERVVRELGGNCLCHDGQVRGGCRRLRQVVGRADLVVFITSVNSHSALAAVKEECRRCAKPFCALARTGPGSLQSLLKELAA